MQIKAFIVVIAPISTIKSFQHVLKYPITCLNTNKKWMTSKIWNFLEISGGSKFLYREHDLAQMRKNEVENQTFD